MRVALALFALLLAGCSSPSSSVDARQQDVSATAASTPWTISAEGTMGWIAAAGTHMFAGDLIVGARSHEQCPEVSFLVPPGSSALRLSLEAGSGPATVAIGGPDGVTYVTEPLEDAAAFEAPDPTPGVWQIELKPLGAMVDERRVLAVEVEGSGTPPLPLVLQPDADCLA